MVDYIPIWFAVLQLTLVWVMLPLVVHGVGIDQACTGVSGATGLAPVAILSLVLFAMSSFGLVMLLW